MNHPGRVALFVIAGLLGAAPVPSSPLPSASLRINRASAAQLPKPEDVVQVRLEPARLEIKSGGSAPLTLVATILEGFHINSNKPAEEYLIPSQVELLEAALFVLEKADYPAGVLKSFGFAPDEKLSVYEGTIKVPLRLRAKPEARRGNHTLGLVFRFQACNDQICLRPARRELTLSVRVR